MFIRKWVLFHIIFDFDDFNFDTVPKLNKSENSVRNEGCVRIFSMLTVLIPILKVPKVNKVKIRPKMKVVSYYFRFWRYEFRYGPKSERKWKFTQKWRLCHNIFDFDGFNFDMVPKLKKSENSLRNEGCVRIFSTLAALINTIMLSKM